MPFLPGLPQRRIRCRMSAICSAKNLPRWKRRARLPLPRQWTTCWRIWTPRWAKRPPRPLRRPSLPPNRLPRPLPTTCWRIWTPRWAKRPPHPLRRPSLPLNLPPRPLPTTCWRIWTQRRKMPRQRRARLLMLPCRWRTLRSSSRKAWRKLFLSPRCRGPRPWRLRRPMPLRRPRIWLRWWIGWKFLKPLSMKPGSGSAVWRMDCRRAARSWSIA